MRIQTRNLPAQIIDLTALPYPPFIQRILATRGITQADELQFALRQLHPVSSLRGATQAAQLLADAIQNNKRILIVGDYDADGATATAVTIRALRLMGYTQVNFLVPDRFKYGYGLTPEIIALAQPLNPWLIMTVDNGVSSVEGIEAAQQLGYKTLITDHHLPGKQLPDSDVMVNPNHPHDHFASKHLAGVGVVFYVMLALKQELIKRGYFQLHALEEPNLTQLLDLVALGTVADVVPLDANNRILVEQGLRCIRAGKGKAGILALLALGKRDSLKVVSSDFGFVCGPRLNAAGRLADMSVGIRCLLTDDIQKAQRLALQLNSLNEERKRIETDMKQEAEIILQALGLDNYYQQRPPIMCLYQAEWHEGVIGILASRIKERYYRPTIVFANAEDGLVKGSGRCIEGLHLRDLIEEVAITYPHLIKRFGGHAMAAGLTLAPEHLDTFIAAITKTVEKYSKPDTFHEIIYTDGKLAPQELTLLNADLLQKLAPWGQWFPEPQFEGEFNINQLIILKDLHIKAILSDSNPLNKTTYEAMHFFADFALWPTEGQLVKLVYKLAINEFRGQKKLQLQVVKIIPNL